MQRKKLKKEQDLSTRYRKIGIRAVAAAARDTTKELGTASDDQKLKKRAEKKAGLLDISGTPPPLVRKLDGNR